MAKSDIHKITALLKKGGAAILPAGTVYGLFCSALSEAGVKKIYKIKGRSFEKPLQVFFADVEDIKEYAITTPEKWKKILSYLPGPYTIVLKLRKKHLNTFSFLKTGTCGFRVVDIRIINEIINELGGPLASTSANISGGATPVKFREISPEILKIAGYNLKNDLLTGGKASSVIDMTGKKEKIIRK
jgi:L-threonylcarbamoyladenylate synthase